jgi:hypothetical protein
MTDQITDTTRFAISDDTVAEEIEGELVLLDLQGDVYFSLNPVGRVIWEAIAEEKAFGEVVDGICEEFEVEREVAAEDARDFLNDAIERELLSVVSGE